MKMKSVLFASVAVLFTAGSVSAADLTNPFGLPEQGGISSDTRIELSRTKYKDGMGKEDNLIASEEIQYGLTDNLALTGTLYNKFDIDKMSALNNQLNLGYQVGLAYNIKKDNFLAQVHGSYFTYDEKSHKGYQAENGWQKYVEGGIKVGYYAGCGFTPYATYAVLNPIDSTEGSLEHSAFVGAHKTYKKWAADAGIRYDFTTAGKGEKAWSTEAEIAYNVTDNVAVALYGTYYIGGSNAEYEAEDTDHTVGLRLKMGF
jgi:hypothetical protein